MKAVPFYRLARIVLFAAILVLLATWLNLISPNIPDPDSFYHFRHASIYQTNGLFTSDFPWAQYSVIKTFQADIWYGFHLLLIPFTLIPDQLWAIKLASIFLTSLVFLLFAVIFYRLDPNRMFLWLAVLLSSSATFLFRIILLRPHVLSLALACLLFTELLFTKPAFWLIFSFAFFSTWFHLALGWLIILVYLVFSLATLITTRRLDWRPGLSLITGLILGWLARPNPLGAFKIAYVQVVQLLIEKRAGIPLQFGNELLKLSGKLFFSQLWPLIFLGLLSAGVITYSLFSRQKKERAEMVNKTAIMVAAILAGLFLLITFFVAWRSLEIFLAFAIITLALLFRAWQPGKFWSGKTTSLIIIFIILQVWNIVPSFNLYLKKIDSSELLKSPSLWLRDHAKMGEIVFNPHWDRFANLFFWNSNNYYINGMDPIFEYAYNPSLYWKTHYYAIGKASNLTCGQRMCTEEMAVKTDQVLREDFHAHYVILEKDRDKPLYEYLNKNTLYAKVFEVPNEVVFLVK